MGSKLFSGFSKTTVVPCSTYSNNKNNCKKDVTELPNLFISTFALLKVLAIILNLLGLVVDCFRCIERKRLRSESLVERVFSKKGRCFLRAIKKG